MAARAVQLNTFAREASGCFCMSDTSPCMPDTSNKYTELGAASPLNNLDMLRMGKIWLMEKQKELRRTGCTKKRRS